MLGERLEDPHGREGGGVRGDSGRTEEAGMAPIEGVADGAALEPASGCVASGLGQGTAGLGLLPLTTRYGPSKTLRHCRTQALWPAGEPLELEGFELHQGLSLWDGGDCEQEPSPLCSHDGLGWWRSSGSQGGQVAGTYLHGIFDNGPWRRRWLNLLRQRRGLAPLSERQPHHASQRELLLDRLADAFEVHVDLHPLLR